MKTGKQSLITDSTIRYLILLGLLGGLFIHSFVKYGLLNQVVGLMIPKATAEVPVIKSLNGFLPDWSRLKFSDMIISESGSVTFPGSTGNETRIWQAGQSIAEFLELGDFEESEMNLEELQISSIAQALNINLDSFKLSDFDLVKWQTLPDLVNAIPELGDLNIQDVIPIRDFLQQVGISYDSGRIQDILPYLGLSEIPIGQYIDLSLYNLTDIPGLQNTPINKFNNWQDSTINGVPGLTNLTWDNLPGLKTLNLSFIGQVDLPLREIEANRTRSISGSYQEGFNVPCLQNDCAHFEASGLGKTTGVQWISGKYQQVGGGFGILKALNGGKEPTGRNPFGSAFKQVVWEVNEAEGSVQTTMFFRICKRIPFIGRTCSPYFIGPVPFIKYREKDSIIFGQPNTLPQ